MASRALRKRKNWQTIGGAKAGKAEKSFFAAFVRAFENSDFRIRRSPNEFKNIYNEEVILHESVLERIYRPDRTWTHGVVPDYAIDNLKTKKTLYVEVKRQDGWVEGKARSAGRGNAHERSCKFFTPGLMRILRKLGNIEEPALPFWVVLQGDIARDPCRVREVTLWYAEHHAHFFMWSNSTDEEPLLDHFNRYLRPLLEG